MIQLPGTLRQVAGLRTCGAVALIEFRTLYHTPGRYLAICGSMVIYITKTFPESLLKNTGNQVITTSTEVRRATPAPKPEHLDMLPRVKLYTVIPGANGYTRTFLRCYQYPWPGTHFMRCTDEPGYDSADAGAPDNIQPVVGQGEWSQPVCR